MSIVPIETKTSFVEVLDYKLATVDLQTATSWALTACQKQESQLLVTLNPEIIMLAQADIELKKALLSADLTVADGIGLTWAANRFGHKLSRVAGVELCENILKNGGSSVSVYFLGSKEGVAKQAAEIAEEKYGIIVAGYHHGYFNKDDAGSLMKEIADSKANFLIAGLGEGQELFLHKNRNILNIPLMIGAGGTLDVLSGKVKRSPVWTHKLRLEWAYRIFRNPSRWYRLPRLIRFVLLVLRSPKNSN